MKPIFFNTEMVKAILDGRKTVTRKIVKNRRGYGPDYYGRNYFYKLVENLNNYQGPHAGFYKDSDIFYIDGVKHIDAIYFKQYYKTGDILYVKESWKEYGIKKFMYKADGKQKDDCENLFESLNANLGKWKPSIHMPKEAARIFLKVKEVMVERLRDIMPDDVIKEGLVDLGDEVHALDMYAEIWDNIYAKSGHGWDANPWVWVIEFERISKEDAYAKYK